MSISEEEDTRYMRAFINELSQIINQNDSGVTNSSNGTTNTNSNQHEHVFLQLIMNRPVNNNPPPPEPTEPTEPTELTELPEQLPALESDTTITEEKVNITNLETIVTEMNNNIRPFDVFDTFHGFNTLTTLKNIIYEKCIVCDTKINVPKVTLYCGCNYHLGCFLLLKNEEKCLKCEDKILKEKDEDYPTCSICFLPLKEELEKLKCKHTYHIQCIHKWRTSRNLNSNKCPLCRAYLY